MALLGFVGLCLAAGLASSGLTISNVHHWYLTLTPPPLCPPPWLFAPVWTGLYIMMGVAAWLVWRQPDLSRRSHGALTAWGWQLAINAIWAPVFFGLHFIILALLVNLALVAALLFTIRRFLTVSTGAALLLLPYIAWTFFANYLNAGFWWFNH